MFENRAGLYPPLYGALARLVAVTGLNLEWSGRAVSAAAGALAVGPVYWTARRLSGESGARFAALLFTISPLVLRWSARVMTDALFLLLVAACLHLALEAWLAARRFPGGPDTPAAPDSWEAQDSPGSPGAPDAEAAAGSARPDRLLAAAMGTAVLAGLTRYQGVLLLLPLSLAGLAFVRACRRIPWRTALTALLWGALPAWMAWSGFAHGGQFADRTTGGPLMTALTYWITAESFVLIAPYYFGYPVAALALAGLFVLIGGRDPDAAAGGSSPRPNRKRVRVPFLLLHGSWALAILAVQSAFLSFQYRYMMPLLPGLLALAGLGAARLEAAARGRWKRAAFSAGLMLSIVYLTLFSCAVLVLQRGTFGDQRAAADWIRQNVSPDVPVFSNEHYGKFLRLGSVKLSFWTGRPVQPLLRPSLFPGQPPEEHELPPGSILVLGNAYGGDEALAALYQRLSARYRLRRLQEEPFDARTVPLHDDVMVNPLYNQSVLGWVMRYVPQRFVTQVFQVEGRR